MIATCFLILIAVYFFESLDNVRAFTHSFSYSLSPSKRSVQSSLFDGKDENLYRDETKFISPSIQSQQISYRSFISSTRRGFLQKIPQVSAMASISIFQPSEPSVAATTVKGVRVKGAAEYDLEYYFRDLVKGNTREGNLSSSPPPPALPPRILSPPSYGISSSSSASIPFDFPRLLLNDRCDGDCIAVSELSRLTSVPTETVSVQIRAFRDKVSTYFSARSPWRTESVTDEYFFDVTAYALYRVASEIIPKDYALRDRWVRNVGRETSRQWLLKSSSLPPSSSLTDESTTAIREKIDGNNKKNIDTPLTGSLPTILRTLDSLFLSTKFVSSYKLVGGVGGGDELRTDTVFDRYDDEDVLSGASVNCLLSLFRPATLGASLQITAEGSRFLPDFVGPVLAALWEGVGLRVEYESYFVDSTYRPNPKDFFPDEMLIQFTLSREK